MDSGAVRITADTNVLVRAVVRDDEAQARVAIQALSQAELIAVALPSLCEFVWVLRKVYGYTNQDIAAAIRALMNARNVEMNRPAVELGLAVLKAGGDFADAAIAYEGSWMGGATFVSFDKHAVSRLAGQGHSARLL